MPVYAADMQVFMSNQLSTAAAVSALTNADPGVATSTAHGFSNLDSLLLTVPDGMTRLNGQAIRAANVATDTFELESYDTTSLSDWVSGTVQKVDSWYTMCMVDGFDTPDADPNRIDITTVCDNQRQEAIGLAGASSGSLSVFIEPGNPALDHLANLPSGTLKVFRYVFPTGEEFLYTGEPNFKYGNSATAGEAFKGSIPLSMRGRRLAFAAP